MQPYIRFAGFYDSVHNDLLDRTLEQMFSDDSGDPYPDLVEKATTTCNWQEVFIQYCKWYAEEFCEKFEIKGTFAKMDSPKFYNFETDRIFVDIDDAEMRRIFAATPFPTLEATAKRWFTSRPGFVSFYKPDVLAWGPFATWDAMQCSCLLSAYVAHMGGLDHDGEIELMESAEFNGRIDGWISDALGEELNALFEELDRRREAV